MRIKNNLDLNKEFFSKEVRQLPHGSFHAKKGFKINMHLN